MSLITALGKLCRGHVQYAALGVHQRMRWSFGGVMVQGMRLINGQNGLRSHLRTSLGRGGAGRRRAAPWRPCLAAPVTTSRLGSAAVRSAPAPLQKTCRHNDVHDTVLPEPGLLPVRMC
jgi:hypothetical protein